MLEFLRRGESGLEAVEHTVSGMIMDCRHTFDIALAALSSDGDISAKGADVRETDQRINAAEEDVRRALVVHVAVRGGDDVGQVLTYMLMVKKLERVGDQNKNIYDLAEDGLRISHDPDYAQLEELQREVSEMFAETNRILLEQDADGATAFRERADELRHQLDAKIMEGVHSDERASLVVPRVLLYRYIVRVVANLASVATMGFEPIDRSERHADGTDDTDD